jgi:hypothetical protein
MLQRPLSLKFHTILFPLALLLIILAGITGQAQNPTAIPLRLESVASKVEAGLIETCDDR